MTPSHYRNQSHTTKPSSHETSGAFKVDCADRKESKVETPS